MNILKNELKYLLLALKKFLIFWLVPALLSIYMYLIGGVIIFEDMVLAEKFLSIFTVSYKILEMPLSILWPVSFILIVFYICKLHFRLKIKVKTILFLVLVSALSIFLMGMLYDIVFDKWLNKYRGFLHIIEALIDFIVFMLLFPFCVFKVKDIIRIHIIFIKKYFILFVLLLILNILLGKIINIISNLPRVEYISGYTFANLIENLSIFRMILTVIFFKNRKLMQANLFKLLKVVKK
jgi:hypothetical protein